VYAAALSFNPSEDETKRLKDMTNQSRHLLRSNFPQDVLQAQWFMNLNHRRSPAFEDRVKSDCETAFPISALSGEKNRIDKNGVDTTRFEELLKLAMGWSEHM